MPTTNPNLNVIVVFPSLRFSLPCPLNLSSSLLHHTTQSPFSPRCNSDEGCLRWRKARTCLGIPEYDCETTESSWQQPVHIHEARLMHHPVNVKIHCRWRGANPYPIGMQLRQKNRRPALSHLSYGFL